MNGTGETTNWTISFAAALVLHAGGIFFMAENLRADALSRTETEISILTLPTPSASALLGAKNLDAVAARPSSEATPSSPKYYQHPERLVLKTAIAEAINKSEKVASRQPEQLAALDTRDQSEFASRANSAENLEHSRAANRAQPAQPVETTRVGPAIAEALAANEMSPQIADKAAADTLDAALPSSQFAERAPAETLEASNATIQIAERPSAEALAANETSPQIADKAAADTLDAALPSSQFAERAPAETLEASNATIQIAERPSAEALAANETSPQIADKAAADTLDAALPSSQFAERAAAEMLEASNATIQIAERPSAEALAANETSPQIADKAAADTLDAALPSSQFAERAAAEMLEASNATIQIAEQPSAEALLAVVSSPQIAGEVELTVTKNANSMPVELAASPADNNVDTSSKPVQPRFLLAKSAPAKALDAANTQAQITMAEENSATPANPVSEIANIAPMPTGNRQKKSAVVLNVAPAGNVNSPRLRLSTKPDHKRVLVNHNIERQSAATATKTTRPQASANMATKPGIQTGYRSTRLSSTLPLQIKSARQPTGIPITASRAETKAPRAAAQRLAKAVPRSFEAVHQPAQNVAAAKSEDRANRTSSVTRSNPPIASAIRSQRKPEKKKELVMVVKPNNIEKPGKTLAVEKFGMLLDFLKGQQASNCFVAIPAIMPDNRVALYGFGKGGVVWQRFVTNAKYSTEVNIASQLAMITQAQCQVANFARSSPSYPSFTLSLVLKSAEVKNGGFLSGHVLNLQTRALSLFLIDDSGVAVLLNDYLQNSDISSSFDIQLRTTGGFVSTSQLLLAVATEQPLNSAEISQPIVAKELLIAMEEEISSRNMTLDLAIGAFTMVKPQ